MLFCSRWLCPPTPSIPLSADTANNGCLHSVSLIHSSLCVWPILASGRGGGEPKKELGFLYFSFFHVLRILMSSMFFPPPAYFMGTYETSWFICAESLRLIISLKNTSRKGHEGKEDLGGYPEYKKTLISSPASAAASLGLARWQQPCKLQPPLATLLQITAPLVIKSWSTDCSIVIPPTRSFLVMEVKQPFCKTFQVLGNPLALYLLSLGYPFSLQLQKVRHVSGGHWQGNPLVTAL